MIAVLMLCAVTGLLLALPIIRALRNARRPPSRPVRTSEPQLAGRERAAEAAWREQRRASA